jgi:hypothetical protein
METAKKQAKRPPVFQRGRGFVALLLILVLSLAYSSYGGDGIGPKPKKVWWRYVPATLGPNSIFMGCVVAEDNDMPVDYNFVCTNYSSKTSGWRTGDANSVYTATGLTPNTKYTFNVHTRDNAGTENSPSFNLSATTDRDTTPAVLRLDLNYESDNNDANTQDGFTNFTLADSGSEVNDVIIDISGNVQSARREDPYGRYDRYMGYGISGGLPGDPCYYHPRAGERIYRDFIFGVNPSGVTITLWGLGTNRDCNITIWAYDACSTGDVNRVAKWYANGTYIFDTNFIGGPASWPKYVNERYSPSSAADLYKYAFSGKATSDNLGRIILTSSKGLRSPSGEPFSFVDALKVEPNNPLQTFVPTPYAHRPVPFDNAQNVPVNTLLKWIKGADVVKHDLYLDVNETKVADATRASHDVMIYEPNLPVEANAGYDPYGDAGFLALDTTYYWRVDENAPPPYPNLYKGEVWSFTTAKCAVVENFNSYVATEDLRDVWKDYWTQGPPLTSAEVYLAADPNRGGPPYQSMRYDYKNNLSPYYSEVRADIGTGAGKWNIDQNWLGMGAKALVLWFYGTTTNDPNEQMYVKLTDGGDVSGIVEYDGDMNDIKEPEWQEWNIDLQDFVDDNNVNLASVSRINIGFGDGTTRGTGRVYFEDIGLCVTRCVLAKRSADFAKVDYAPLDIDNHPCGDCKVDYQELKIMTEYWLDVWNPWWTPPTDYVAYWPMNEGAGNKIYTDPYNPLYTGTFSPSGVTWATPGEPGWGGAHALYFDGNCGTGVSCGKADLGIGPTPPDVNAMTLSIWVKWLGRCKWDFYLMTKTQGLISKENGWDEPYVIFRFEVDTAAHHGGFALRHYEGGDVATPDLYSPPNILIPFIGHWIHLAATYPHPSGNPVDANSYAKLYLNGVEVASGPWRFSHGDPCTTDLTIGNNWSEAFWPSSPESFYGYLDEPRIYNRVLTAEEIAYMAGREPPCDLYSECWGCPMVINFKDYDVLMNYWLKEELWP